MSGQVSRGSAGEYQADERAGVARLSWRVSGRLAPGHIANEGQRSQASLPTDPHNLSM